MKKFAFITGTSKGIGRAIAELLLNKQYIVFGYSRTNTIIHSNFTFIKIDLSNLDNVKKITFPKLDNDVLLINNAAQIGDIMPLNLKKETNIINEYNLNIITPTLFCAKFINTYMNNNKIILNVSSGAANNAIASWNTYCSTKSALDSLSSVIKEEQYNKLSIFSIHPGIINTEMQKKIRKTDPNLFPLLSKFINYHSKNQLEKPEVIAEKFLYIIENHDKIKQNIVSMRDIHIN